MPFCADQRTRENERPSDVHHKAQLHPPLTQVPDSFGRCVRNRRFNGRLRCPVCTCRLRGAAAAAAVRSQRFSQDERHVRGHVVGPRPRPRQFHLRGAGVGRTGTESEHRSGVRSGKATVCLHQLEFRHLHVRGANEDRSGIQVGRVGEPQLEDHREDNGRQHDEQQRPHSRADSRVGVDRRSERGRGRSGGATQETAEQLQ